MAPRAPHRADARILGAAASIAAEHGPAALTVAAAAERSGLPATLVWARYPTSRQLVAGLVRSFLPQHPPHPVAELTLVGALDRWLVRLDGIACRGGRALRQLAAAGEGTEAGRAVEALVTGPACRYLHELLDRRCGPEAVDAVFAAVWGALLLPGPGRPPSLPFLFELVVRMGADPGGRRPCGSVAVAS